MKMSISPSFHFPLRKKEEIFFPASRERKKGGIPYSVPVAGTDRERGRKGMGERESGLGGGSGGIFFFSPPFPPARVGWGVVGGEEFFKHEICFLFSFPFPFSDSVLEF